jgi:hypothetical protein
MLSTRALILALAACGGGGGFPGDAGPDAAPPGGRFTLAWTVSDTNSQAITCGQVGAQVVTIALRNREVQGASTEAFTCSTATGTSSPIAPGTYDMTFELNGLAGLIATAPAQNGIVIRSNETIALEPLAFAVDATGGLELLISSNQAGGNCAPTAAMGAGITNTTITLAHTDNTCEPVTFQVAAGATQPASTYTVDCANPTLAACIENDQKLTVSPVPSGNYRIQIRGKVGALDCWNNDDTLVVPPLSKILKTTLNLAKQMTVGCPP